MTREEALERLSSSAPRERLRAARVLSRISTATDLPAMRSALLTESDHYVRTSLEAAIGRVSNFISVGSSTPKLDFDVPPELIRQIRSEVTGEISGQILHEISSPLGLAASAASREIPDFENSRTRRHIETLKRIFDAITNLKSASGVPKPIEFDLAELIDEIVATESHGRPVPISVIGLRPLLLVSDPGLLRLAICNGVRNAIDAMMENNADFEHPIVVTWGQTEIDFWVSTLDQGSGLVGNFESAFQVGRTTKRGHTGYGLTIARQAIESLGGCCTLLPARGGGTRFEVRWPR